MSAHVIEMDEAGPETRGRSLRSTLTVTALLAMAMVWSVSVAAAPTRPSTCLAEGNELPLTTPGSLTMSINATTPPTQYVDPSGKLVGMNVELGNEIARRLCLKPAYANVQFEVQIPGLRSGRWDMINTGFYFTPERAKSVQLIPYSVGALALVTAFGNPIGLKTLKDLAGKRVGVEAAGIEEAKLRDIDADIVRAGRPPVDIRVFNTYADTFQALQAGQIDAVFASDAVGTYYQGKGRFTEALSGLLPGMPAAFATSDPRIAKAVVSALSAMVADGSYSAILGHYGVKPITAWPEFTGRIQYYFTP